MVRDGALRLLTMRVFLPPRRNYPPCESGILLRLADRDFQRADAVDATFDLIAGRQRGDARRRAGHDDIAGADLDLLREVPDDFRYAPDQLGKVPLLPLLAIDRKPDLAGSGMADLRGRLHRRGGGGMVEGLADLPRPLFLARGLLQVATGQVDADRIAVDVIERLLDGNVEA